MYANKKKGDFEARQAESNAQLAGAQADQIRQQGVIDAAQPLALGRQVNAGAEVALAANNISSSSGSAAGLMAANSAAAAVDAARIKNNAARMAWGVENQAQDMKTQAAMIREGTTLGNIGLGLNAAGSLAGQEWRGRRKIPTYGMGGA